MAEPISADLSVKNLMTSLFKMAMTGDWDSIVNRYREDSSCHTRKITRSGDTALHVAVADGREDTVRELLEAISTSVGTEKLKTILGMKNVEGNTPLHIAASTGSAAMCEEIAKHDLSLVGVQNSEGETPLFLAAQQGHKDAFLCLTELCGCEAGYQYCTRGSDGLTVLHSAISEQNFDLAFQIICLYGDLVDKVNAAGDSPLNFLARKPSAFKSGCKLGHRERIIYKCVSVNPLEPATSYAKKKTCSPENDDVKESRNPETQHTTSTWGICFQFLRNVVLFVNPRTQSACERSKADPEKPKDDQNRKVPPGSNSEIVTDQSQLWSRLVGNINKSILAVLGFVLLVGHKRVNRIKEQKEKHTWSKEIMNKLLENETMYTFDDAGSWHDNVDDDIFQAEYWNETASSSSSSSKESATSTSQAKNETAMLTAARNGITEMVVAILQKFPVAVNDLDADNKNVVLIAVETRQLELYKMLLNCEFSIHVKDNAFGVVDNDGNGALHLAAEFWENHEPWLIPGEALQMQREIKWYKFVEKSMPPYFFPHYNVEGQTPKEIFTKSHKELVKDGRKWMTSTTESCSVVAALIATVAFATSTAIPGGTNDNNGKPKLENQLAFTIFGITSLVALFFSVTSLAMFLAILTSRYQQKDFETSLPRKLLLGLTSLFVSVASIVISFCSGHFFVLKDTLKFAAFPVYFLTCLPISFFAAVQFPLYLDLIRATFTNPFGESSRAGTSQDASQLEHVQLSEVLKKKLELGGAR